MIFLREDPKLMQMLSYVHIPYPENCKATYLIPNGRIIEVAFEHCSPLIVDTSKSPFKSTQRFPELNGKKVIISHGYYLDGVISWYIFINDDGDIVLKSSTDGREMVLETQRIRSCSRASHLYPLEIESTDGVIKFIVNCTTSPAESSRYIVKYDAYDDILNYFAMRELGDLIPSQNGEILAIVALENNVHSLMLLNTSNPLQTPARENFDAPVTVRFLNPNGTLLVLYKEGENLQIIDVQLFMSTRGQEGTTIEPGTVVKSLDPIPPPVMNIDDSYVMMTVWNEDELFFDVKYRQLGIDSVTSTGIIPSVSSNLPLLSFLRTAPRDPPTTNLTISSSTTSSLTTSSSTTSSLSTSSSTTATAEPTRSAQGSPVIAYVLGSIAIVVVLLALLCLTCIVCIRQQSKKQPIKKAFSQSGINRHQGELVAGHFSKRLPSHPAQEVGDGNNSSQNSSQISINITRDVSDLN